MVLRASKGHESCLVLVQIFYLPTKSTLRMVSSIGGPKIIAISWIGSDVGATCVICDEISIAKVSLDSFYSQVLKGFKVCGIAVECGDRVTSHLGCGRVYSP